jgi:hypothetical protein
MLVHIVQQAMNIRDCSDIINFFFSRTYTMQHFDSLLIAGIQCNELALIGFCYHYKRHSTESDNIPDLISLTGSLGFGESAFHSKKIKIREMEKRFLKMPALHYNTINNPSTMQHLVRSVKIVTKTECI